jgi:hypothetical protein
MKKLKTTAFSLLAFSMFCLSCGSPTSNGAAADDSTSGASAAGDFTIVPGEKVGLITPETATREAVLQLYGENARIDSVYLGEGMYDEGVVLFSDDPKKKVELFWRSSLETGNILLFKIMNTQSPKDGTVWKTDSGITLGTSMEEVEKLNGMPFTFYGFEWEYGGIVADWAGGKLSESLKFRFKPAVLNENMTELTGNVQLQSNGQKVKDTKPGVDVILVNLTVPDE